MRLDDILPDKWEKTAHVQEQRFKDKILNNLWDENYMLNVCMKCKLFRPVIEKGIMYMDCVFVNKCIKQYPPISCNKEFK